MLKPVTDIHRREEKSSFPVRGQQSLVTNQYRAGSFENQEQRSPRPVPVRSPSRFGRGSVLQLLNFQMILDISFLNISDIRAIGLHHQNWFNDC